MSAVARLVDIVCNGLARVPPAPASDTPVGCPGVTSIRKQTCGAGVQDNHFVHQTLNALKAFWKVVLLVFDD